VLRLQLNGWWLGLTLCVISACREGRNPNFEDRDGDGYTVLDDPRDCDDRDASLNPQTVWYADQDLDGFGHAHLTETQCEMPATDGDIRAWLRGDVEWDCDDLDASVYPDAPELCDGQDNNCDDELMAEEVDGDLDGSVVCEIDPEGWDGADPHTSGGDCDDGDPLVFPGAAELDSETACMIDGDGDGYGSSDPAAGIAAGTDCDDDDAAMHPDDDDGDGFSPCDGDCDEADALTFPGAAELDSETECMTDTDGDGWGENTPLEEVTSGTDCDDGDPSSTVIAEDGDCDGVPTPDDCDDGDGALGASAEDGDCDGALTAVDCDDGDASSTVIAEDGDCDGVLTAADCDDGDSTSTAVAEDGDCDGVLHGADCSDEDPTLGDTAFDGDCDGVLSADDCDDGDEALGARAADADCDGTLTAVDCDDEDPSSTVVADDGDCDGILTADDCDDDDPSVYPGAEEVCGDFVDSDCDGLSDEDDTDCGTCPEGWIRMSLIVGDQRCIKSFSSDAEWTVADDNCRSFEGGSLVRIASTEEKDFIHEHSPVRMYWIGMNDMDDDGIWTWSDGEPVTYTNWSHTGLEGLPSSEDCVYVNTGDAEWGDGHCWSMEPYICQRPVEFE
jgi:hypothetical protein